MCGIVGFNWEDKSKVTALAELLNHRGPEQQGFHVADGVSIGHKRLCILDLSQKGRQPLYNEDRSICISYNGEIYNFKQLRETLRQAGHHFTSATDTEVLVHGYEQWGTDILSKLNGQFAFCIFDQPKNLFFIARDRLGIRPLYYYADEEKFIFGSEVKVFLKSDIKKKINREVLDHYMLFGNSTSNRSILEDVHKLPPAHYLVYDLASKKIQQRQRYWQLSFPEDINASENEITEQISRKLECSIEKRLIADVPLGAFLSGGVDSSIIVAIMSRYVKDLKTFSIRFDYPEFNESRYAKIISDKFHTTHYEITFDAGDVKNLIGELPYYYDEPFGDPSMVPTCLVSRVARQEVTVSLSGTGGDELFGGYPRYRELVWLRKINRLPAVLKLTLNYMIDLANVFLKKDKLSKLQSFLGRPEPAYLIYLKLFSYMFRSKQESIDKLAGFEYLSEHFCYEDDLTNALNFDCSEYLPDCLLTKEDRASMAVSLEARVPFLDHELVEFAGRIPSKMKIQKGIKKYLLKKAFADVLPSEILYRRKQGFGVPLVHYFRDELRDFAYREIFDFDEYNYYDKTFLRKLWNDHQSRRSDYSRLFWSIMMFNLWYKQWMI
jgi:asparagine synthase (glutamine-hydrolysing)